jgi:uncharacterized membrane protein
MMLDPAVGRTSVRLALVLVSALACARCGGDAHPDRNAPATTAPTRVRVLGAAGPRLHAVGFEPGWTLDIYEDSMVYVGRYGEERVVAPRPRRVAQSEAEGATYHVRSEGYEFRIRVFENPCRGPGGRGSSELTVVLEVDGQQYHGCGSRV